MLSRSQQVGSKLALESGESDIDNIYNQIEIGHFLRCVAATRTRIFSNNTD